MQQLRPLEVTESLQHIDQLGDIIAIDWTEIPNTQTLEEVAAAHSDRLGSAGELLEDAYGTVVTTAAIAAVEFVPHLLF